MGRNPGSWLRTLRTREHTALRERATGYSKRLEVLVGGRHRGVLDVGCGSGSPVRELVHPGALYVGVDMVAAAPAEPTSVDRREVVIQADVRSLGRLFAPRSFDVVVALDVIEHLLKGDGVDLLRDLEALARRRVVVFTPNGFLPQHPPDRDPYQVHRSGWTTADFTGRGYVVEGVNGWRPLRGEFAEIRWRPKWLWYRLSVYTPDLFVRRPERAFQLLSSKDIPPPDAPDG